MHPAQLLAGGASAGGGGILSITFSANASNVNLKTAIEAIYGAQASPVTVVATINAGVTIGSTSSAPAFRTGGFASGSSIRVNNYGRCAGKGGKGGDGGDLIGHTYDNGHAGSDGSDAVSLDENVDWDNTTTGEVFGGGGGGGGGGAGMKQIFVGPEHGGSGGGGGQGDDGGARGDAGAGGGNNGTAGTPSARGIGGAANPGGAKGANGGNWGISGGNGGDGGPYDGAHGGNGGSAGKAVALNGHVITWLAGNNTTQVKGPIS